MPRRPILSLLKDTFDRWSADKAPRLGAALAYYSAFATGPLVLIAIGVAGLIFGKEAATRGIVSQIQGTVGEPVALAIEQMLAQDSESGHSIVATVVGVVMLLVSAMGVFGELQDAFNTIWKVTPKSGRGLWGLVRDRFLSLTMVFGTGFLLLVSLVLSAVLSALQGSLQDRLPGGAGLWSWIHLAVSFGLITFLFALLFKYVPDARIAWRDVWLGAVITALLFTLGKSLLGWYLAQESTTSGFGAAGSLVIILLWVYYASQILLFGAEFTCVYASQYGSGVKPTSNARLVTQEELQAEGMPHAEAGTTRAPS